MNGKIPPTIRFVILFFVLLVSSVSSFATGKCSNCNREGTSLYAVQGLSGEKKMLCLRCYILVPRCGICRMPLKRETFKRLTDGRTVCGDDFNAGIFAQQDAEEVARETRRELERTFYRFSMTFPETNVTVSLVAADHLYQIAGMAYDPRYPELSGLTKTTFFDEKGRELFDEDIFKKKKKPARMNHQVFLLSGLPRARLTAVCAHEFGHVWHMENLPLDRSEHLEGKTREAFCELLSFQLMGAMNQPFEQAVIEANLYTYGQAELLIEVEKEFGFNRILEWMKHGQDVHISSDDLARLQILDTPGTPSTPGAAALSFGGKVNAPQIPDTLLLKGIMGSGTKKLALINNQTFSSSETAKVKVGRTNISVQVIEIRESSVVIRTNNAAQADEIFLQK